MNASVITALVALANAATGGLASGLNHTPGQGCSGSHKVNCADKNSTRNSSAVNRFRGRGLVKPRERFNNKRGNDNIEWWMLNDEIQCAETIENIQGR
jgi:hypothetical protein